MELEQISRIERLRQLIDRHPKEMQSFYISRGFAEELYRELVAYQERDQRYVELLYQVSKKTPGETRHQTALRYIREREQGSNQSGSEMQKRVRLESGGLESAKAAGNWENEGGSEPFAGLPEHLQPSNLPFKKRC